MTDATAPCSRCGVPYIEGRVCAGSNFTLLCNEPVSTDPGAVTHECLECGRTDGTHSPGCPVPDPDMVCSCTVLRNYQAALTAMTTRAEAAEADLVVAHRIADAALLLLEARGHLANEPDNLQWREFQRQAEAVLGGRRHTVSLPSTRLDGGKAMPVERRPECPHGVGLCTATCPSKAEAPPREPAWYVVEDDGSYNQVATEREAQQLLKCATEGAYITREKPPEPAPAGLPRACKPEEACKDDMWCEAHNPRPAPQPAAAPKVLPVEELRREMATLLRESEELWLKGQNPRPFGYVADRLERGGEGKGNV